VQTAESFMGFTESLILQTPRGLRAIQSGKTKLSLKDSDFTGKHL